MADIDFTDISACLNNNEVAPLYANGTNITASWYTDGFISMGTRPHGDNTPLSWTPINPSSKTTQFNAVFPWFIIHTGGNNTAGSANPAPNTRVEIYDINVFVYSKSQSTWIDLTAGDTKDPTSSESLSFNLLTNAGAADSRVEAVSGHVSYKVNAAKNPIRGRIAAKTITGSDISGIFMACKARLVLDNPAGVDDRASSTYVVSVGCDYAIDVNSTTANFAAQFPQAFGSRFTRVPVNGTERIIYGAPINPPGIPNTAGTPESSFAATSTQATHYYHSAGKRAHVDLWWLKRNFPKQYFPRTVINDAVYNVKLKTTLVLDKGTGNPTFARNSVATVFDNRGKLIHIPAQCARLAGARFVRNLVNKSALYSDAAWIKSNLALTAGITDPFGGVTASRLTCTANAADVSLSQNVPVDIQGNNRQAAFSIQRGNWDWIKLSIIDKTNGKSRDVYLNTSTMTISTNSVNATGIWANVVALGNTVIRHGTTTWYRISLGASNLPIGECFIQISLVDGDNINTGNTVFTGVAGVPGFVNVAAAQFENVPLTQTSPSTLVTNGVRSNPWHGAGTDGCRYFSTTYTGAIIPEDTLLGYQWDATDTTNKVLWNRDLTNAAWVHPNITVTRANSGIDDSDLNDASLLTCNVANGTILQNLGIDNTPRTFSVYIKRVTGTGTISITRDGGTTWTNVTSSINSVDLTRVSIENNTLATAANVGIRLGTVGDSIIVDYVQDENKPYPTNPIYTQGTVQTRLADSLTYPVPLNDTEGSILATVKRKNWVRDNGIILGSTTKGIGTQEFVGQPYVSDGLRNAYYTKKKFKPGIYLAIPPTEYRSTTIMNTIYSELVADPNIMGLSFEIWWGELQRTSNGPVDLSWIYSILERLGRADMGHRRYVRLVFADRSFSDIQDAYIVPSDLFNSAPDTGANTIDNKLHYYGYISLNKTNEAGGVPTKGGFNLKFWNPTTRSLYAAFCQQVIDALDDHPGMIMFSTSESARGGEGPVLNYTINNPSIGYTAVGGTLSSELNGMASHWATLGAMCNKTIFCPQANYPVDSGGITFLSNYMNNVITQSGFGFDTPNVWHDQLSSSGNNLFRLNQLVETDGRRKVHICLHAEGDEQDGRSFVLDTQASPEPTPTQIYDRVKTYDANVYQITRLDSAAKEEQRVELYATGGTYTLSWNGNTTSAIPYNASPLTVEAALGAAGAPIDNRFIGSPGLYCEEVQQVAPSAPPDVFIPGFYFKSHNLSPHYAAIQNLHGIGALNGRTAANWQVRVGWAEESVNFRGFQLSVPWGLYETGVNGGNFNNLDFLEAVVNDLGSKGKYVILMPFQFREFRNNDVSDLSVDDQMRYLLPEDLRTHQGMVDSVDCLVSLGKTVHTVTSAPADSFGANGDYAHIVASNMLYGPKAGNIWPAGIDLDTNDPRKHWLWDNAYAYSKFVSGSMGFDMKIYKPALRTRMAAFQRAVADRFNSNQYVIAITTTESAVGEPIYLGSAAGGIVSDGYDANAGAANVATNIHRAMLTGKTSILQTCRGYYPNKIFAQDINTPLDTINYVKEYFDQAPTYKMGATSSDTVWWSAGLKRPDEPKKGCLVRMSENSSVMPIISQWQQWCWDSDLAGSPNITSTQDFLNRFQNVFAMATVGNATTGFGLNAHMVIIQLETAMGIWVGGGTYSAPQSVGNDIPVVVPSLKNWLKAKFTSEGITDGSGGLNTTRPGYVTAGSNLPGTNIIPLNTTNYPGSVFPAKRIRILWNSAMNNVPAVTATSSLTGTGNQIKIIQEHQGGKNWTHQYKNWIATHTPIVNDLSMCGGLNKEIPTNMYREVINNDSSIKMMASWADGEMQVTSASATAQKEVSTDTFYSGFGLTSVGVGVQSSGFIKDVYIFQSILSDEERLTLTDFPEVTITASMSRFLNIIF